MKLTILSLFPDIPGAYFESSIMAKAIDRGLIEYRLINWRDYALDKHKTCDDSPYGGGPGMVLMPGPLDAALRDCSAEGKRIIYPTPSGLPFTQDIAADLAQEDELFLICGRYEGLDQRIIDKWVSDELSIGDYVLSSGEVAAMVIVDAVYRLIEGVINQDSLKEESFVSGLLEYPHYTRPEDFEGRRVPEVLLSGHHKNIEQWHLKKRLEKTITNRPDLLNKAQLDKQGLKILEEIQGGSYECTANSRKKTDEG